MKQLIIIVMALLFTAGATAQKKMTEELEAKLQGQKKFHSIKSTVENYFKQEKAKLAVTDSAGRKKIERQRKFWNRDLYWMESHLDKNGEVADANRIINNILKQESINAPAAFGNWEPIGPFSLDAGIGRVNRIAFHPTNPNIIFAGTPQAGLWKTTNSGVSWSCISNFLPSLGISGIVVDENDPNIIYVLTGDGDASSTFISQYGYMRFSAGVLKTTDGGATWNTTGAFPFISPDEKYVGYNLVTSTVNNNLLLAATNKGLFRSSNGGDNWTLCNIGSSSQADDTALVWDAAFKPGSSTTAYCTVRRGGGSLFYRSVDGGVTFSTDNTVDFSPSTFTSGAERIKIAVTAANSSYVYLLAGPGNEIAQTFKGIWRSTDNGANFSRQSSTPDILGYKDILQAFNDQNNYDLALAVSPSSSNTVITGGLVVWRSVNGGVSLSEVVDYFQDIDNSNYIHSDVHDLQYNPIDGRLWAATDGGVSVSTDNGSNWTRRFNMQISAFYHYKPSNQDNLRWGGTQDNGTMLQVSGNTYDEFDGGDGYDVMTDKAPAGNNNDDYWVVNKKLMTDGITDVNITPPLSDNYFPNLDMCPNDEDIIYAGYDNLWISLNRGDDWIDVPVTAPGFSSQKATGNWCVAVCPSNPGRIYCAGDFPDGSGSPKGFYRITGANTETPVADLNQWWSGPKITDIAVNENNSNIVWITFGGFEADKKVYRSSDGGQTWNDQGGNLPNLPVNCILLDGTNVYIGTDIGVYYKNFGTDNDWTPFYNGMPRVPVTQLHLTYNISNTSFYIEASTFGRGLWRTEVFAPCSPTVTVNTPLQGQQFFQAGTTIHSTSAISGGNGTEVFYQSGNAINLTPGFHAQTGNYFRAFVAPCNTGIPQRPAAVKPAAKKQTGKKYPLKAPAKKQKR